MSSSSSPQAADEEGDKVKLNSDIRGDGLNSLSSRPKPPQPPQPSEDSLFARAVPFSAYSRTPHYLTKLIFLFAKPRQHNDVQIIPQAAFRKESIRTPDYITEPHQHNDDVQSIPPKASEIPCCIFKIPHCLTRGNRNSYGYQPKIVSIGPYHHRRPQLNWIQGQKERFLDFFLSTLTRDGVKYDDLVGAVAMKEQDIRNSYSEHIPDNPAFPSKLIKMMVLDGCFLLTLFLKIEREIPDPIFNMPWVLPTIRRDLLLLENQIPLFVLLTLLETAKDPLMEGRNLSKYLNDIALKFFSYSFKESETLCGKNRNHGAKHLLDLVRESFIIPITQPQNSHIIPQTQTPSSTPSSPCPFLKLTLSAKKLRNRGIKFKAKKDKVDTSFLNISFEKGVLQIPEILLDDFRSMVWLNCIAFEQLCADSTNHITSYAMLMGCLISNEKDASFLVEEGIIQNYYGTDNELAGFFKRITKDYVFEIEKSYLGDVFKRVNEYAANDYHVLWEGFKYNYLDSPWIFLSTCAALALLVMTLLQVIYAASA